jgi:hypothetical protein
VNGVAVLSMTADDATGYSGTPPTDTATTLDGGAAASSTPGGGCACDTLGGGRLGLNELFAVIVGIAGMMFRRRRSSLSPPNLWAAGAPGRGLGRLLFMRHVVDQEGDRVARPLDDLIVRDRVHALTAGRLRGDGRDRRSTGR